MPRSSGLRLPAVVMVMGFLLLLCFGPIGSKTYSYCWTNEQLSMRDQYITTFFVPGLPCSSSTYAVNYTVQGFQGNFDVIFGDQLCGTDWRDDSYFTSSDLHYDSGFQYSKQWSSYGDYSSFFPKVNIWCRWILGCKIQLSLCLSAN